MVAVVDAGVCRVCGCGRRGGQGRGAGRRGWERAEERRGGAGWSGVMLCWSDGAVCHEGGEHLWGMTAQRESEDVL